ncbi:hypothetical protein AB835_02255 [Candidatus Endobugula sertula]|uniref:Sulfurtransferase complex subunit TusB n=1 Tax=Candidatus Endobugula sertula TaxID=62101 RepID=A0A1D2QT37_9GAMM|nr:hypothetical protein AB835_02255 [Candidatus Endobugula sertula]
MLHTVNKSPFLNQTLKHCLGRIQSGDSVLLLEDGVYAALSSQPWAMLMNPSHQYYAIKADVEARGLGEDKLLSHITLIDYEQFVELSTEHSTVQSWY